MDRSGSRSLSALEALHPVANVENDRGDTNKTNDKGDKRKAIELEEHTAAAADEKEKEIVVSSSSSSSKGDCSHCSISDSGRGCGDSGGPSINSTGNGKCNGENEAVSRSELENEDMSTSILPEAPLKPAQIFAIGGNCLFAATGNTNTNDDAIALLAGIKSEKEKNSQLNTILLKALLF
jgi:hypothetical protein